MKSRDHVSGTGHRIPHQAQLFVPVYYSRLSATHERRESDGGALFSVTGHHIIPFILKSNKVINPSEVCMTIFRPAMPCNHQIRIQADSIFRSGSSLRCCQIIDVNILHAILRKRDWYYMTVIKMGRTSSAYIFHETVPAVGPCLK